jgi:WD40 repeat protein
MLTVGSCHGVIQHWDVAKTKLLHSAQETSGDGVNQIYALEFSHDGSIIVTGGHDYKVRLYDEETKRLFQVSSATTSALMTIMPMTMMTMVVVVGVVMVATVMHNGDRLAQSLGLGVSVAEPPASGRTLTEVGRCSPQVFECGPVDDGRPGHSNRVSQNG